MFIVGESGQDEDDLEEEQLIENFGGKVDNVQLWLRLELIRESKHWLPLRVAKDEDDDEIEDTDRIILFDQLDGFLYQFQVSSYIDFSSCAASAKRNLTHPAVFVAVSLVSSKKLPSCVLCAFLVSCLMLISPIRSC